MKLVEIAGHLIDPGKVSYVGPLIEFDGISRANRFAVVIDGAHIIWHFSNSSDARQAHERLLAAIESAQPECCVSWPKHGLNEKGGHLYTEGWQGRDRYDELIKATEAEVAEAKEALDQAKAILAESKSLPLTAPLPGDNGAMGASDALVGVEA